MGLEAIEEGRAGSGVYSGDPGEVGRAEGGRESHPEGWEGSGGPSKEMGGVGRPHRRAGRCREDHRRAGRGRKARERTEGPNEGPGGVC